MSVTLSGTVSVEKSTGDNPVFTITITATPTGGTAGSTEIQASAADSGSYEIENLPPGQCVVTFQADQLSMVKETVLLSASAANIVDVEMFYSSSSSSTGPKLMDPLIIGSSE
jgi:hypothetical protein